MSKSGEVLMISIDLADRTAIVTGSGQGLGAATASLLHAAGANVVINYFDDPAGANKARADAVVKELGDRAIAVAADVRDLAACSAMVDQAVKRFGKLDILVNNAGILRDRSLKNMSDAEWQSVIDTNLTGVFHTCRAAVNAITDGGRIVNIASIAGVVGFFGQANYSAAKAGVIGMTKVLAKELAKRNITVNAVAPGVVMTEMGQSIPEAARTEMLKQIPLNRFAEASEIASAVLFLCSDLASYMTGQTLHVNGGWWG
jgi:3-oxoacyl-[acyl-carrier protein] reductase